jgi:glutathione synthase/RimK-type ligase-like ATP-grasp enzyme
MPNHPFKIGMLTCQRFPQLYDADQALCINLKKQGINAHPVIWDDPNLDVTAWDLLIFRNTWDYFEKKEAFFQFLALLAEKAIPTLNPLSVISKNIHKFYLKDVEPYFKLIPTCFLKATDAADLHDLLPEEWHRFVVKPAVSAGAYDTCVFNRNEIEKAIDFYAEKFQKEDWLVQKFLPQINTSGEISMVFIQNEFSHAVRKTPIEGDFRVQSMFGGQYETFEPTSKLISQALNYLKAIEDNLLFARFDGVMEGDEFLLMEIEMIEPDLYFEFNPTLISSITEAILHQINIICNKK